MKNLRSAIERADIPGSRSGGCRSEGPERSPTDRAARRVGRRRSRLSNSCERGPGCNRQGREKRKGMPAGLQEVERPARARQVAPAKPGRAKPEQRPAQHRRSRFKSKNSPGRPAAISTHSNGASRADDLAQPLEHSFWVVEREVARPFGSSQPDSRQPPERVDREDERRDQPDGDVPERFQPAPAGALGPAAEHARGRCKRRAPPGPSPSRW